MGALTKLGVALGLFPWSLVSILFRSLLPQPIPSLLMGGAAIFLIVGVAQRAQAWLGRPAPAPLALDD